MTARFFVLILVALFGGSLWSGCASMGMKGTPLGAHYEIEERFRRLDTESVFGLRIHDKLEAGSISKPQMKALADYIAHIVRETRPSGAVLNLNAKADESKDAEIFLDVDVTTFEPADEAARKQGERSHLSGTLVMTDTNGKNRGTATIQSTGFQLNLLNTTRAPDTVRFFATVIAELIEAI